MERLRLFINTTLKKLKSVKCFFRYDDVNYVNFGQIAEKCSFITMSTLVML